MAPTKAKATPAKKVSASSKSAKISKDKVTKVTKVSKTPKEPKSATPKSRTGGRQKKFTNIYSEQNFLYLWVCVEDIQVFTHSVTIRRWSTIGRHNEHWS